MCYFGFFTIDLQLFIHCSLRLGCTYESLAIVSLKKFKLNTGSPATINDEQSLNSRQTKFETQNSNESFLDKYSAALDSRGNYMKAKNIIKKSLHFVSDARALVARPDKETLCDIDYDELDANSEVCNVEKLDIFSSHNEQIFELKSEYKNKNRNIIDLHTELLYAYQRMSLKLAVSGENKAIDFDAAFESVFKECRKNKVIKEFENYSII